MKQALKYFFIITFLLVFIFISVYQVKAENYKKALNLEYDFYSNKKRIHYTPFVIFYIDSKVFKRHKIYWNKMNNIYYKKGVFKKNKNKKDYKVLYNIEYNAYFNYCFFNENDLGSRSD